MSPQPTTGEIRSLMHEKRTLLSETDRHEMATLLTQQALNLSSIKNANKIGAYFPVKNELNITLLAEKLRSLKKKLYMPIITNQKQLVFGLAEENTYIQNNQFGIPEPQCHSKDLLNAQDLDIILIPLLAFDEDCYRIGTGGGYYDRTLEKIRTINPNTCLIGVGYEFQKTKNIIVEPWDIQMDMIVTNEMVYHR